MPAEPGDKLMGDDGSSLYGVDYLLIPQHHQIPDRCFPQLSLPRLSACSKEEQTSELGGQVFGFLWITLCHLTDEGDEIRKQLGRLVMPGRRSWSGCVEGLKSEEGEIVVVLGEEFIPVADWVALGGGQVSGKKDEGNCSP